MVVLTFVGPFTVTSNAYFACFAALGFSILMGLQMTDASGEARAAINGNQRALIGLLVSSIALFLATLTYLSSSVEAAWACMVSLISIGAVLSLHFGRRLHHRLPVPPAWRTVLLILLCLLWTSAVWFTTFNAPFVVTGSGYFSAWSGLASTFLALLHQANRAEADSTVADVRAGAARHMFALLSVASLVLVLESNAYRTGLGLYALLVGGFSLVATLTVFIHRAIKPAEAAEQASETATTCHLGLSRTPLSCEAVLAVLLSVWWGVGAVVITFWGPFNTTGNAYFASWAGFACALGLCLKIFKPSATAEAAELEEAAVTLTLSLSHLHPLSITLTLGLSHPHPQPVTRTHSLPPSPSQSATAPSPSPSPPHPRPSPSTLTPTLALALTAGGGR